MIRRALVVEHVADGGPGRLGEWLPTAGMALDVVRPYAGEPVPTRVEADALVVLGGAMSAYDDVVAPWLPATRDLLATAVAAGTPVLGVCLGAQLLAVATGGSVRVDAPGGREIGVCAVRLRPEATGDPLLGGLPPVVPALQWHGDVVEALPPGVVALASSDAAPYQAFRIGAVAWGVQWHPEVAPDALPEWAAGDRAGLRAVGVDADDVVAVATRRDPELVATWRPVAERFARL